MLQCPACKGNPFPAVLEVAPLCSWCAGFGQVLPEVAENYGRAVVPWAYRQHMERADLEAQIEAEWGDVYART